MPLRLKL
ncbi:hypothetical protein R3I94_008070 [Phoxinus phoxinus]